ncbi:cytochrome c oxidase assembly protein [Sphingomonas glaciei]|uniref:Cytochrome c oxidase assembly protein n=1 Tax=Sphingomonas glaciei TaxID=2938948 RepID=A0ABY5MY30_9SPHN|nr:cytochrome c oxidase assembly protein [Sphingomonas glaciei]UUR08909.1 cytochrome c oxidase assembly protein [Sphingomonas glaciei]
MRDWLPYCGAAPVPADLLGRWNLDPLLLLALALGSWGLWRLARNPLQRRLIVASAALALILFVSPFCALSSALFSARVTHHVLLAAVLAPLLVYGMPQERSRLPGSLALWTGLQAATFWLWHAPGIYAAALSSNAVYWSMQLTITGTAFGFWAAVRRASSLSAVAGLLVSTVQMGLLGALITFAGNPLYAPHIFTTEPWGFSALEDQQTAGLIMWAPSAALYLAAALIIARRWLADQDREATA